MAINSTNEANKAGSMCLEAVYITKMSMGFRLKFEKDQNQIFEKEFEICDRSKIKIDYCQMTRTKLSKIVQKIVHYFLLQWPLVKPL